MDTSYKKYDEEHRAWKVALFTSITFVSFFWIFVMFQEFKLFATSAETHKWRFFSNYLPIFSQAESRQTLDQNSFDADLSSLWIKASHNTCNSERIESLLIILKCWIRIDFSQKLSSGDCCELGDLKSQLAFEIAQLAAVPRTKFLWKINSDSTLQNNQKRLNAFRITRAMTTFNSQRAQVGSELKSAQVTPRPGRRCLKYILKGSCRL